MPPWRTGSPGRKSTRRTKGPGAIWYRRAAEYCKECPSSRAARSWRPQQPRCPKEWAVNGTGTTATPGCATPASPCRRSWSRRAPTRQAMVPWRNLGWLCRPGRGRTRAQGIPARRDLVYPAVTRGCVHAHQHLAAHRAGVSATWLSSAGGQADGIGRARRLEAVESEADGH
jgi:hypothetical protein